MAALDIGEVRSRLGSEPLVFGHGLAQSSLLSLETLARSAEVLPQSWTNVTCGDVAHFDHPPTVDEASATGAIRGIGTEPSITRTVHLELVAGYRQLALDVLGNIPRTGHSAAAFCASSHAVVPPHVDGHHHLLLQIVGTKRITVGPVASPLVATLTPGTGVFIPAYSSHSTENGDDPSVSFSVAWSTAETIRMGFADRYNRRIRRLGLRPTPVGRHAATDHAKAFFVMGFDRARILAMRPHSVNPEPSTARPSSHHRRSR